MTANEIVSSPDFMTIVKYAILKGYVRRKLEDLDDFAQDVAMHILKYPPKKEYSISGVIMRTCKWVQQEETKKRKQEKFEKTILTFDLPDKAYSHTDFDHIDNSDDVDELMESLTDKQKHVIGQLRTGKSQEDIAKDLKITPQAVSCLYRKAIENMRACI